MKEESELMQKQESSDSDYLPEWRRQIVEKGQFARAVAGVNKPDAFERVAHTGITNSRMVIQGCSSSSISSFSKVYKEDIVHVDNNAATKENSKAKEDSQMLLRSSQFSEEGKLKAMEENFKAKEDNGATECKNVSLSRSDSQMVFEASHGSADGNLKALSSKCRERPSPIRGVILHSPSLNETQDRSLIKRSRKEVCFSFQATDKTKTAEGCNNQSVTLESKIHPNDVVSIDETGDPIGLESIVESQSTNTSGKMVQIWQAEIKLSAANIIKPEKKIVVRC